jgi:2-methylisocitrate lyase-like PEP mutase family enzyme
VALENACAAGCNLEDTDHAAGRLRDASEHARRLRDLRDAAPELVINARIDVFLRGEGGVPEALERADAYFDAGVDCVYPIGLADREALRTFVSKAGGPVNVLARAEAPPLAELTDLGVARVSYGSLLHRRTMEQFETALTALGAENRGARTDTR